MDHAPAWQKYVLPLVVVVLIGGVLFAVWSMISPQATPLHYQSTYTLSPTPTPAGAAEPEVTSWKTYSNNTYNFSLNIPADWHMQDYAAFYNNKGTLLAFSPDQLPCATCTYLHDGYFSIRIYNQQTDPQLYDIFQQNIAKVGHDPHYQQVALGGKPALLVGNTVDVANQGWVYEFSLDKDNGNAPLAKANIFQKILSSFKFTGLFDN